MPELPEVETVVRLLNNLVVDREIKEISVTWNNIIAHPSLEEFSVNIKNQTIKDISRRGKYIIFHLDDYNLVSHLRMEGKYYVYDKPTVKSKHTHVIIRFKDNKEMHYHDTRKFGKMYLYPKDEEIEILANVGYEPWDINLTGKYLKTKARNRTIAVKSFLLDQSIIAGIGNIYVNEILFICKIHPNTRANKVTIKEYDDVVLASQDVLERAIKDGGTTIRSYTSSLGVTGLFQQSLHVHNKDDEPCPRCGTKIIKIMVNQRGSYLCPTCQKRK